jgi:hypothetical protein
MDLVQQGRHFLNLVQHNPGTSRATADQGLEPMWIPGKLKKERGVQKIETEGIGQYLLQPGAFARSAGAEKEEGSVRPLKKAGDDCTVFHVRYALYDVILQCKSTLCCTSASSFYHRLARPVIQVFFNKRVYGRGCSMILE